MPATANINQSTIATYSKSAGFANFTGTPKIESTVSLSSSDISKVFTDSGTISSGHTTDVTSVTDPFGVAISFATVKGLVINNTHNAASLTIGGGSNALLGTDSYTLKAGKTLTVTSPFSVDGTHKSLLITPSAPCTYQLLILGA